MVLNKSQVYFVDPRDPATDVHSDMSSSLAFRFNLTVQQIQPHEFWRVYDLYGHWTES